MYFQAHQSRYCSGIPNPDEVTNVEAQLSRTPLQGMTAAELLSLLSVQHAAKMDIQKTSVLPPSSREKSPKGVSGSTKSESSDEFCCILCGYKETTVDKLKDHINIHFIGQVKKRKADNDVDTHTSDDSNHSAPNETNEDHIVKKIKKEDDLIDEHDINEVAKSNNFSSEVETDISNVKQEADNNSLTCSNCNIAFVNTTTYVAYVQYYCKNKKQDEHQ